MSPAWFLLAAGILAIGTERANLRFPVREAAKIAVDTPMANSEAFAEWVRKYSAAPITEMEAAGVELATQRRKEMRTWIETDPQRAWESRISWRERQGLPTAVQAELEMFVSGTGDLEVFAAMPRRGQTNDFRPVSRTVTLGGRKYEAFVYGRRVNQPTGAGVSLHGVALDGVMALSDSPVRLLESDEPSTPGKALAAAQCPISESDAAVAWAESGSQAYQLCSAEHINALAEMVWQQELQATATVTTGTQSALVLIVDFPDLRYANTTRSSALEIMQQVDSFYRANSFGTLSIETVDVTPVMRLPQDSNFYYQQGSTRLMSDAISQAQSLGYEASNYRFIIVTFVDIGFPWGGVGTLGGSHSFIQGPTFTSDFVAHELGHNLGVWHAGGWLTDDESVIGPGLHVEYGNAFDVMGSGSGHLNGAFKLTLGWLQASNIGTVRVDGTNRIYALDMGGELASDKAYTLRIPATPALHGLPSDYWIDYRQQFADHGTSSGALIHWATNSAGVVHNHLLDMNPAGVYGFRDGALRLGRTFVDNVRRICITPIAKGPGWLDMVVKFGPSNVSSPTLTLNASTLNANVGQAIQFTANAMDSDGDSLAYYWDFDDLTVVEASLNQPSASKSWSSAREYSVRCVVSDMKGGEASASVLVRIGTPVTYHVSGTVMSMAGVRVHNGLCCSDYRATFTDSQGGFALTGLPAGSYSLAAAKPGYWFKPMFANPVTVGPTNVDGLEFESRPVGSPLVTGFSPSSGIVGTLVTIDGADFSGITSVKFGNTSAAFTNESRARIRARVPWDAVTGLITVSNGAGTDSSSAAFTVIPSPPVITRHPQSQTHRYTSPVYFYGAAEGSGPLSFQWRKDGVAIPGATDTNYFIINLQPEHAGIYDFVASNPHGAVTSDPAHLTLGASPQILEQPQSTNVVLGDPVVFTVRATGTPPLHYQWYRRGQDEDSHQQLIPDANEQSYTIAVTQEDDEYLYYARVTNEFGLAWSTLAELGFLDPPYAQIVYPRSSTEVPVGRIEMLAEAQGPFPIQRVELFDGTNKLAQALQPEGGFYRLIFTNNIPGQRLWLTAGVTDSLGHQAIAYEQVEILLYLPLSAPDAEWKYLDNGSDAGPDWRTSSFEDELWKTGSGYFGFGSQWQGLADPGPRTEVDFGQNATNKHVTTYFRLSFMAPDLAELSNALMRVTYAGGIIVYLNGSEILRSGMSTGAVDYLTLAASEGGQKVLSKPLDPGLFVRGENQLAVEVHLGSPAQESMLFNLRLLADLPPGPPWSSVLYPQSWEVITEPQFEMRVDAFDVDSDITNVTFLVNGRPFGVLETAPYSIVVSNLPPVGFGSGHASATLQAFAANAAGEYGYSEGIYIVSQGKPGYANILEETSPWTYNDPGSDSGTAWRDFPGPATMPGWNPWYTPFEHYGESPSMMRFRTFFDFIVQPGVGLFSRIYTNVALYLLTELSDGTIIYLNGTEVFRYNLPPGPITNGTYTGLPPSGIGYVRTDIDARVLQSTNDNLIAVQMHQNQPDSETFVFALSLIGMIQPSFPELRVVRMGSHVALEWDWIYWHSVRVEQAANLDGPWCPLDESPGDIPIYPNTQRFFRLRWQPITGSD